MSIDLSLERIRRILTHLPKYTRPTCHIAGTNGKGSVTALLSSIFTAASLSVGRFNSPHLTSIYDCISIDGKDVTPDVYANARADVENADREYDTKLTSFELLTVTALLIFERAKVDIAVVEVGLGGRRDATNAILDECIAVSGLTAVDLDHQSFLGGTVEEIAREKSAIARPGKPFVLGPQKHGEVEKIAEEIVTHAGGDFVKAPPVAKREWDQSLDGPEPPAFALSATNFQAPRAQPITLNMPCFSQPVQTQLPLFGEHQLENLATASSIVSSLLSHTACSALNFKDRVTPDAVAKGIQKANWAGRLSYHTFVHTSQSAKPLVVLADGAHNAASAQTLSAYVTHVLSLLTNGETSAPRKVNLTFILGLSHSPPKTPSQTLKPLFPPRIPESRTLDVKVNVAAVRFTPPEGMPWVHSVPPAEITEAVRELAPGATTWTADDCDNDQLVHALDWATKDAGAGSDGAESLVIVAGSLYLVADFYRLLHKDVPTASV
ncbi:hypothetical protein HGRIS_005931 [Hohenbuehelia grisea]|uniref:Dihydrofolate synthetase n=1 Tax=Hohenbuehelia grisea TaxID=104357 RepID=A0ABR3JZ82_9AGAR